jgi:hypothetical protein
MRSEGQSVRDIVDSFKAGGVDITPARVYAMCPGRHKKPSRAEKPRMEDIKEENIIKVIRGMIHDIHDGYQQIFKHLRLELIKSRAQVHNMMRGAGIKVGDE